MFIQNRKQFLTTAHGLGLQLPERQMHTHPNSSDQLHRSHITQYHCGYCKQGLRASSLQFTSPLEFNAKFRDGFTLRHELTAGSKIRDPVPAKFKHVTNIIICTLLYCDYVTYVPALKFPKSWLRTLGYRPKIHHFFFSHKWGTRFKYLSKLCPYILMYSALHIMQWFSQFLDVFTPKIKRKFFDFYILWIKTNVAYTRLEMIAGTKCCTTTTGSNRFVTLYYKLLPAVRSSSKHGRRWSSLLLYSISMTASWSVRTQQNSSCSHCAVTGQLRYGDYPLTY